MRWPDYHCLDARVSSEVSAHTSEETRELAFELLACAEHAERLTAERRSRR